MTEYMTEKAVVKIHGTVDYTRLKEAAETYIRQIEQAERRRINNGGKEPCVRRVESPWR